MTGPSPPRQAIIRADANARIGIGHIMRCRVLADALAARGWRIGFACHEAALRAVPALDLYDVLVLSDPAHHESDALKARWPNGADLLVVDHYQRDAVFETACQPWAARILVIDDLADRRHDADWLLDPTFGRAAADYDGLVPPTCRRLIGSEWALLRPAFARRRTDALARRTPDSSIRRVLVALGGTDPDGRTGMVLSVLAERGFKGVIDVVAGAAAPHLDAIRAQISGLTPPVTLHIDSHHIADLMAKADLAIGAGGTMSWERCCLGVPSIALIIAENQRHATLALDRAGAVIAVDAGAPDAAAQVRTALDRLWSDGAFRNTMSERAAAILDGCGAARVVDVITPEGTPENTLEGKTP